MTVSEVIKIVITVIVTSITTGCYTYAKTSVNTVKILKESQKLIYKRQIKRDCITYINQQYIEVKDLEILLAMFECYKDLGGNSFIEEMVEDVKYLEVRG